MTVLTLVKGKLRLLMMSAMSKMWATERVAEVNDLNTTMSGCVVSERDAHALMWLWSSLNCLCVFCA